VTLRTHGWCRADGNLWVGERDAGRQQALGGKPSTLGGEKGLGRDTQGSMVMKAAPVATFIMIESDFRP
jgi:hypothetical protein